MKQKLLLLVAVLCSAFSVQAATITYQLTTHVDGRTLKGTATVDEGASLQANMPQNLWRGYTTYKYYSDQALTQEITTAPAEDATVYVDYVFDPPFILSEEGQDPVYHYLRTYNSGGSYNYLVIYDQSAENEWDTYKQTIKSWKSVNGATPKAGSNYPIAKAGHDQWAFYGDGYAFQVRLNDSSIANNYLIWRHTSRDETPMGLGAKPEVGWQLYVNTASNSKLSGGTMAMGPYNTTNYLASLENVNSSLWTDNLTTSKQYFDEHNQLVYKPSSASQTTTNKNNLWWYAFFATPVTDPANSTDIWHVTYKIQKEDGTWYDDIVVQKSSSNLTPTWPVSGFEPAEGCKYDYFYRDASFSEKFEGAMPNNSNTTLYIKEKTIEYLTNAPWKTLVIPFSIDNLPDYFGADYEGVPAVDVLEFQEVQNGVLTSNAAGDFYRCKLIFNPVRKIEAYKPYFFRVNRADEDAVNELYAAESEVPCGVTTVIDEANPGISISMEGTLEPNGVIMDASDGLHFYFGYNDRNETYNFYRVTTTIPKNRCWFYVIDNRGYDTKKLNVTFDMDGVTGIGQVMANTNTANDKVYNLNGQQVAGKLQKGIYIVNGKKVLVK